MYLLKDSPIYKRSAALIDGSKPYTKEMKA